MEQMLGSDPRNTHPLHDQPDVGERTGRWDAIVLAGGAARRLDGADKPGLDVGGTSMLDRVVEACAGAGRVVVVGPRRPLAQPVTWTREEPAGSGPVAAIAAAVPLTDAPLIALLAADLPWIAPAVPVLLAAVADAAVLVDARGRRNLLAAAWRRERLAAALAGLDEPAGAPVRALYRGVACTEVPDPQGWGEDCDTWEDLARAREREP
jgi:molybdopterin-guanine dinucleotide biosynthesis protein A